MSVWGISWDWVLMMSVGNTILLVINRTAHRVRGCLNNIKVKGPTVKHSAAD